uniref:ribosomal protein S2 n=1 Tax=Odontella aurita TaxID=265563 RepID=UPI002028C526|nr:ribosomal protein S2 [Odontella aurita]QYB22947.1 ribosomal protein S2 [Odontella aurita]
MKQKSIKFKKYSLLKLYLVRFQTYLHKTSRTNLNIFLDKNMETTEIHFKTALKIIHEFHYNKRKIVFLGNFNLQKTYLLKSLKKTKHNHMKLTDWVPGIFKNSIMFLQQTSTFKNLNVRQKNTMYSKKIKDSLSLVKRPDLIIILESKIEPEILEEIYSLNIPVISFDNNLKLKDFLTQNYQIKLEFSRLKYQKLNLCDLIIASILKTPTKPTHSLWI